MQTGQSQLWQDRANSGSLGDYDISMYEIRGCFQRCLIDCAIMLEVSIVCGLDFFM